MEDGGVFEMPLLFQMTEKTFDGGERPRVRRRLEIRRPRGQPRAYVARLQRLQMLETHQLAQMAAHEFTEMADVVIIGNHRMIRSAFDMGEPLFPRGESLL